VLCRILTELKLLGTPVGIITLASGVGDDVVGWVRQLDSCKSAQTTWIRRISYDLRRCFVGKSETVANICDYL